LEQPRGAAVQDLSNILILRLILVAIPKAIILGLFSCCFALGVTIFAAPELFAKLLIATMGFVPNLLVHCGHELVKELGLQFLAPAGHCPAHCGPYNPPIAEQPAYQRMPPGPQQALPTIHPEATSIWGPLGVALGAIALARRP